MSFLQGPLSLVLAAALLVCGIEIIIPGIQYSLTAIVADTMSTLDFIFHEVGHPVFSLLGNFLGVLGGTLFQLLVPAAVFVSALRHGYFHAGVVCVFWFGENLICISRYMADARAQSLELFSPGMLFGETATGHDWNYIFGTVSLLWADTIIAGAVYLLGVLLMLLAVLTLLISPEIWGRFLGKKLNNLVLEKFSST